MSEDGKLMRYNSASQQVKEYVLSSGEYKYHGFCGADDGKIVVSGYSSKSCQSILFLYDRDFLLLDRKVISGQKSHFHSLEIVSLGDWNLLFAAPLNEPYNILVFTIGATNIHQTKIMKKKGSNVRLKKYTCRKHITGILKLKMGTRLFVFGEYFNNYVMDIGIKDGERLQAGRSNPKSIFDKCSLI